MSTMLLNIVADMLTTLIECAKQDDQIAWVVLHLVDGGLSILQYVYDTILVMEHDLDKAQNLKLLLSAFEKHSGLKINFHKSELFCLGEAKNAAAQSLNYSVVHKANSWLNIWKFQFITASN